MFLLFLLSSIKTPKSHQIKLLLVLVGCFQLFFYSPNLTAQANLYFKNISVNDGLTQNHVIAILEDHEGFMWFATKNGLNKYDGNQIINFNHQNGLQNSLAYPRLNCLALDSQDRIWIGTEGKGLNWYDKKTEKFHLINHESHGDHFQGGNVRNMISRKNGKELLVLTEAGLNKIDLATLQSSFIPLTTLSQVEIENTAGLFEDKDGRILIGVGGMGILFLHEDGHFSQVEDRELDTSINGFTQADDGTIWVITENQGVFTLNEAAETLTPPRFKSNEQIATPRLLCISKDRLGNIWMGTENGGLEILYKETGELVNYTHNAEDPYSLANNSIYSIFHDKLGNAWVGTFNQGVCYWNKRALKFEVFRQKPSGNSLSSNAITSFSASTQPNKIWIGTDGGGLNSWDRTTNQFQAFTAENTPNFSSNAVLAIHRDQREGLWIGTWGGGLMHRDVQTGKFLAYDQLQTSQERPLHVFDIDTDQAENLWLATFDRGLCYYDLAKNEITSYLTSGDASMASPLATCLAIAQDKSIWVGTVGGLHLFTPKSDGTYSIKVYSLQNGMLPNDFIETIYIDQKEHVWVGTGGGGLCLFQPKTDTFQVFDKNTGFPSNEIFSIEEDDSGLFWISTNNGLASFNPQTKQIVIFDKNDGVQDLVFNRSASLALPDGTLLFGGVSGFNVFNPKTIQRNPTPPTLYFTGLKLFNNPVDIHSPNSVLKQPLTYTQTFTLDHKQSIFTINYVGINMTHPEKNQYAYKMDGLEENWNYIGNRNHATYTNLDGGTYTFLLKAANNDGVWTEEPKSLTIIIKPPWWETPLFRTIATLTFIVAAFSFYRLRVRALNRQKERLEDTVKQRTQELVEKQNEIQAQNEELMQLTEEVTSHRDMLAQQHQQLEDTLYDVEDKNKKITDSIRYAETIQRAILPNTQYLSSLFNHYFVIYKPKDIVSGDFYWATEIDGYTFIAVIDCTGHGVPGAFMSMIGNTLLNRIVKEQKIYEPEEILDKLNVGVFESLQQETSKNSDGMDAAIVRITPTATGSFEILFAGAKNSLYVFREHEAFKHQIYKGTRRSIGATYNQGANYDCHQVTLTKNDVFMISSDGIIDLEINKGKRFGTRNFMDLAEQHVTNLTRLKMAIEDKVAESQLDFPLRDDIAIFGAQL